jgi:cellulose synthase/poly-beta-1,6-N-acetylglucosamine synthase-like glycosyltransferase
MTVILGACLLYAGLGYTAAARLCVLLRALRPRPAEPGPHDDGTPVTFLIPARRDALVIGRAVGSLLAFERPGLHVIVVVSDEEPETFEAATRADDHSGRLAVLREPGGGRPSKGRALTSALPYVKTDVVAVFDADSVFQPRLLDHVLPWFARGADVAQVPIRPEWGRHGGWHGARTLLDYASWSRGMAGFAAGFVRLSGTGVFFRREVLAAAGGWRPSLTEDFDLAVRLAAAGARVAVTDCPEVATAEEVPHSARSLLRQRTRWHQGFLEILREGSWRRLPTARLRMQALGPLLVPIGRVMVPAGALGLLLSRTGVAAYTPAAVLAGFVLAADCVVFARTAGPYGRPLTARRAADLLLGSLPFYAVMTAASTLALWRELRGSRTWETTPHGAPTRR